MNPAPEEHNQEHEALMHLLVEEELEGESKQAAEKKLLSCLGCLKEYNAYQRFWKAATSLQYRQGEAEHLKETDVDMYRKYSLLMNGLQAEASRPASSISRFQQLLSLRLFHQPALSVALMFLLVLTLPYLAYRSIRLERERQSLLEANRGYQRALAEQRAYEKTQADLRAGYESQVAALNEKIVGLSNPEMATSYPIAPGKYRGRAAAAAPVKFSEAAKYLILSIKLESNHPSYAVEIVDAARESRWEKSGVKREDEFSVVIPREFFKKDYYVLTIYGVTDRGEKQELVSEFPLRIRGER